MSKFGIFIKTVSILYQNTATFVKLIPAFAFWLCQKVVLILLTMYFNFIVSYRSFAKTKLSWPVESSCLLLLTLPHYVFMLEQVTLSHGVERRFSSSYKMFVSQLFEEECTSVSFLCLSIEITDWLYNKPQYLTEALFFNPMFPRLRNVYN